MGKLKILILFFFILISCKKESKKINLTKDNLVKIDSLEKELKIYKDSLQQAKNWIEIIEKDWKP